MKANDIPVSDLELDTFYGVESDPLPYHVQNAVSAIRVIPEYAFSPEGAKAIIAALASRVSHSTFSHVQCKQFDAIAAVEYLDDAQHCLEQA